MNKLRDQLGVRVDVSDDVDEKEKEGGKKKKVVHQKSRVKVKHERLIVASLIGRLQITGRKENVEEAKKRILAQIDRLVSSTKKLEISADFFLAQADETSEILKIPAQYHSSLIGQSGKYAIRLEEKYSVKITFPRQSSENGEGKTREQLKPDEVLVKGGKKGVAGAKSELLDVRIYFPSLVYLFCLIRSSRPLNLRRNQTMSSSSRFLLALSPVFSAGVVHLLTRSRTRLMPRSTSKKALRTMALPLPSPFVALRRLWLLPKLQSWPSRIKSGRRSLFQFQSRANSIVPSSVLEDKA